MKWTKGQLHKADKSAKMFIGRWASEKHLPFIFHFNLQKNNWSRFDGFALCPPEGEKDGEFYWCELPEFTPEREVKPGDYVGYGFINEGPGMLKMPFARAEVITIVDNKVVMKGAHAPNWDGLMYFSEENGIKTYYFMESLGIVRTWPAMGGKITFQAGDPVGWGMPKGDVGPVGPIGVRGIKG